MQEETLSLWKIDLMQWLYQTKFVDRLAKEWEAIIWHGGILALSWTLKKVSIILLLIHPPRSCKSPPSFQEDCHLWLLWQILCLTILTISWSYLHFYSPKLQKKEICTAQFRPLGRVAMWENGKKYFDKTDIADLPATYKRNRKEIDIVSAG